MKFSEALDHILLGGKATRSDWNGKGMCIFKVNGSKFITSREPLLSVLGEGVEVVYQPHIDMVTAQGTVVPWLASQGDLFSNEWELL